MGFKSGCHGNILHVYAVQGFFAGRMGLSWDCLQYHPGFYLNYSGFEAQSLVLQGQVDNGQAKLKLTYNT